MKAGDTVRFKETLEIGDDDARMIVLDGYDDVDRVAVKHICDLPIPPIAVYKKQDLIVC